MIILNTEIERLVNLPHPITLKLWNDEHERYYVAEIPMLKGCMSDGEAIKEVLEMIMDAKRGWIETKLEYGDEIPVPENTAQVIEYLGEYTETEKNQCYDAVRILQDTIETLNNSNIIFLSDYK